MDLSDLGKSKADLEIMSQLTIMSRIRNDPWFDRMIVGLVLLPVFLIIWGAIKLARWASDLF